MLSNSSSLIRSQCAENTNTSIHLALFPLSSAIERTGPALQLRLCACAYFVRFRSRSRIPFPLSVFSSCPECLVCLTVSLFLYSPLFWLWQFNDSEVPVSLPCMCLETLVQDMAWGFSMVTNNQVHFFC